MIDFTLTATYQGKIEVQAVNDEAADAIFEEMYEKDLLPDLVQDKKPVWEVVDTWIEAVNTSQEQ